MAMMTVDQAWAILGYTGVPTESEINAMSFYINVVSEAICNYTNRKFQSGEFIDEFYNVGQVSSVHTGEFPITSLTSVILDDETLLLGIDYHCDKDSGIIYFDEGEASGKRLVVHYTAGYATIPFSLQQIILDYLTYKYTPPSQVIVDENTAEGNIKTVQIEGVGAVTYESATSTTVGTASASKAGGPLLGYNSAVLDPYVDLSKSVGPSIHRVNTIVPAP